MGSYLTPQNMAIGSTGASALGSIMQGVSASKSDKYNAQIALQNAALAKQNAAYAGAIGESDVGIQGLKTRQDVGDIKAAEAGHGVDVNTGSAKAVQNSASELGMQSAMNIRSQAARQAYGFETQETGFQNEATLDKSKAGNDLIAGLQNAGTAAAKGANELNIYGPIGGDTAAKYDASSAEDQVAADVNAGDTQGGFLSSATGKLPSSVTQSLFGL